MHLREWQQKLALVTVSTLITLVAAEAVTRLVWEPGERQPVIRFDAELGWALRAGSSLHSVDTDRGLDYQIHINGLGWRDPPRREHAEAGMQRVLMLGDSMVFGPGVDVELRCSNRLDALLGPGVEVLNAGVGGWGTDQEYLSLCRDGFDLQPDAVILALCLVNDVVNNSLDHEFLGSAPKPRFELRNGRLELQAVPPAAPPKPPHAVYHVLKHSRLLHYVGRHARILQARLRPSHPKSTAVPYYAENLESDMSHWNVFKLPYSESFESAFRVTEALIGAVHDSCVARGVPLIVFAFPQKAEVDAQARDLELRHHGFHDYDFDLQAPYERLQDFCQRMQVPFLYPIERFRIEHQKEPLFFARDPHPNAAGNQLAALSLESAVRQALVQRRGLHTTR